MGVTKQSGVVLRPIFVISEQYGHHHTQAEVLPTPHPGTHTHSIKAGCLNYPLTPPPKDPTRE